VAFGLCVIAGAMFLVAWNTNRNIRAENRRLERKLQAANEYIAALRRDSEIGSHRPDILRDIAIASIKDERIWELLKKHGYNVQMAHPPAAPGSSNISPSKNAGSPDAPP